MNNSINPIYPYPGIPDSEFIRDDIPMTKEEVRILALTRLRINPASRVLDIGAGTGSVSIEAARLAPRGRVIAVERKPAAVNLIEKNKNHFGITNLEILSGLAPAVLENLAPVDRIFIGGSGGALESIMDWAGGNLLCPGVLVITAITLDTVQLTLDLLEKGPFTNIRTIQACINRLIQAKKSRLLKALNPVFIISAEKEDKE